MENRKGLAAFVVAVFVVCLTAGIPTMVSATNVTVGLGLGTAPEWEGSDDYEAVPLFVVEPLDSSSFSGHAVLRKLLFSCSPPGAALPAGIPLPTAACELSPS